MINKKLSVLTTYGEMLAPLPYLVNYSVVSKSLAERLKLVIVVPVYKEGACEAKENFRPISLFSSVY